MTTCLTRCQQVALWLTQAQTALHSLLTGTKVVQVGEADKSMRFTDANLDELRRYVRGLQDESDCCTGARRRGRAFRIMPDGW